MESKWHFFTGQTPSNTSISNREHALHIKSKLWKNIKGHLDQKRLKQEAIDKERAHKQSLKDASYEMTKNWEDSVEKLQERKEKERLADLKDGKAIQAELFFKMRQEQDVIRKEYIDRRKRDMFISRGYPKQLTSALFFSHVLYDRDRQVEFNERIRQHERECIQELGETLKENDRKDREQLTEETRAEMEKQLKYRAELDKQIEENKKQRETDNARKLKKEMADVAKRDEEMKAVETYERERKKVNRRNTAIAKRKELRSEAQRRRLLDEERQEMEDAIEVYAKSKERIDILRKMKEQEMREEDIRNREKIAKKVFKVKESKEKEEEQKLQQVIAETIAKENARAARRKELDEQEKQIRIAGRQEHLDKVVEERKIKEELLKWEILNRYKSDEAIRDHDHEEKMKQWRNRKQYGRDLLEQIAKNEELRKEEKRIDDIMSKITLEGEDKKFFNYAHEVLQVARVRKRPTYPVEKVITRYRKENRF